MSKGTHQSRQRSEVLQGTLDLMILQTLQGLGPQHGFGIARRIEQVSGDLLLLNQGTVYASLLRLRQEGRITAELGRVGEQPESQVLPLPGGRKQLEKGDRRLAADLRRHRPRAEARRAERCMIGGARTLWARLRDAVRGLLGGRDDPDFRRRGRRSTSRPAGRAVSVGKGMTPADAAQEPPAVSSATPPGCRRTARPMQTIPTLESSLGSTFGKRCAAPLLRKQPHVRRRRRADAGVGIGANTAIFSICNAVLLSRSLCRAGPDRDALGG